MADNTILNIGTGGDIASSDEITTLNGVAITTGEKAQRVKVGYGVDGALQDVTIANGLPVTGAFFQATQPVSFTQLGLTDTQLRAAAVPVSGTFFQATQPVSATALPLPTGASTETTLAALNTKVTAVNTGAVTISAALPAGTAAIGTVGVTALPALVAGTASIGSVVLTPETTKVIGTVNIAASQAVALNAGAAIVGRVRPQPALDYVNRNFFLLIPTAAPATEALISLTQYYNNAAVAATTTPAVVPAGKVLVIMGMRMNTASLAAAGMVVVRLRVNTAGVVAVTSPVAAQIQCGSPAAVAALDSRQDVSFGPQGLHIPAGAGVGLTFAGYVGATLTLQSFTTVDMWGYEYTV